MRTLIGIAISLALVAATGFVCARQGDLPSAGDQDLAIVLDPTLRDERNVWAGLLEAAQGAALDEADADALQEFVAGSEAPLGDALRARIDAASPALDAMAAALGRPGRQVEPLGIDEDRVPEVRSLLDLGRLVAARALLSARAGDADAALADVELGLRLGASLHGIPGGDLVLGVVGISIQGWSLDAWLAALPALEPDAADSRRWTAELARHRFEPEGWQRIWSGEYAAMAGAYDQVDVRLEAENAGWRGPVPSGYLYHPNRTKRATASRYRALAEWSAAGCLADYPFPETPEMPGLREWIGPNAIGVILDRVARPDFERFGQRACALEAKRAAAQVATAVRAHQLVRRGLPVDLSALAPEFLETVPADPFADAPLRWSAEQRRLWSIGADRRDAGGRIGKGDQARLDEPSFELAF